MKIDGSQLVDVPAFLTPKTNYSQADIESRDKWWDSYGKILGAKPATIYQNRDFAMSLKELIAFIGSIEQFLGKDKATGVANYATGGGIYHGFLSNRPASLDTADYLTPEKIWTEGTQGNYIVSELLSELKWKCPAAHDYLFHKIQAKALKVQETDDNGYSALNNPVVAEAKQKAEEIVDATGKAAGAIVDATTNSIKVAANVVSSTSSAAEFLSRYWLPILGVTGLGIAYFAWKNRDEVAKLSGIAARAAVTKGK